jgi:colanic acid/amylovoran biosynthesis glycosyltransferase
MWSRLAQVSGAGWVHPLGNPAALAKGIAALDPGEVTVAAGRALAFSRAHDFETEFRRRMDHMAAFVQSR